MICMRETSILDTLIHASIPNQITLHDGNKTMSLINNSVDWSTNYPSPLRLFASTFRPDCSHYKLAQVQHGDWFSFAAKPLKSLKNP